MARLRYTDAAMLTRLDSEAHRLLAKRAVIDGATLLLNEGAVLPRALRTLQRVAIVGPLAGCPSAGESAQARGGGACAAQSAMAGGYYVQPAAGQIVTVADALARRLPPGGARVVIVVAAPGPGVP